MADDVQRILVVNADDFGLSAGVNRGIVRAHEDGIVTSASLMVRQPAAAEAAAYAREHPRLGVGLHADLGEWAFVDGAWRQRYAYVREDDALAVEREVRAQLDAFVRLVGATPTHVDTHQHAHRHEPARSVVGRIARELGVPVRFLTPGLHHRLNFYGQTRTGELLPAGVSVEALLAILRDLPAGATELSCHPGEDPDLASTYRTERELEVRTLCDPRARALIDELRITLTNFRGVRLPPVEPAI